MYKKGIFRLYFLLICTIYIIHTWLREGILDFMGMFKAVAQEGKVEGIG